MINIAEEVFYEGGPAKGDLIINLLAGFTILGLPFTFAALVRALWLKYKITNKRICLFSEKNKNLSKIIYYQELRHQTSRMLKALLPNPNLINYKTQFIL